MNFQLIRAEWQKCCGWPVNRALMLLLPALLVVQFTLDAFDDRETARRVFSFPNDLAIVVVGMGRLSGLLAVTFVAGCVGEEYRRGTWKMLLPRRDARGSFLAAKGLICLAGATFWAMVTLASGLAAATLYGSILGIGFWSPENELPTVLARLASVGLDVLVYGSTAFAAAVLLRSSYSAMFFAFITLKVLDFAAPRLGFNGLIRPRGSLAQLRGPADRLAGPVGLRDLREPGRSRSLCGGLLHRGDLRVPLPGVLRQYRITGLRSQKLSISHPMRLAAATPSALLDPPWLLDLNSAGRAIAAGGTLDGKFGVFRTTSLRIAGLFAVISSGLIARKSSRKVARGPKISHDHLSKGRPKSWVRASDIWLPPRPVSSVPSCRWARRSPPASKSIDHEPCCGSSIASRIAFATAV